MGGSSATRGSTVRAVTAAVLLVLSARAVPAAENYRYASRARGESRAVEQGEVEILDGSDGFRYRSVTRLEDGRERRVEVRAGSVGALEHAVEEISGQVPRRVEIRRDESQLSLRRMVGESEKRETFGVPPRQIPCAGPSLLALTRRFPFGSDQQRTVFFVDFDGHRISGTLRQSGDETIQVPAGTFECHRLELTLRVFIFRPKVHFWVFRQPPHMLIRQVGKRSALGPVFVTELQAVR